MEIHELDGIGAIEPCQCGGLVGNIHDRSPSAATLGLACFVGGDGHEPRMDSGWVSDRLQAPPRDCPGRLHGVASRLGIAADDERHTSHRGMVIGDQAREGNLVTGGR